MSSAEQIAPLLSDRGNVRGWMYALIIATAGASSLADLLTIEPPMQSANDRSRWCTVWSLVHRGTYTIDEIIREPGWDSIDKVRKDGHFYSSKPALLSTIVAGLYWVLHRTTGLDLVDDQRLTISILLFVLNWLPWMTALAVFARSVHRFAATDFARLFLVTAAAWGTLLTPFQATLNNHTVAAVSVILAVAPMLAILGEGRRDAWRFAMAGFFAAFTVTNEMPAALFGAAMFLILARQSFLRTWLWFVPAALIPLVAFFVTTRICSGGWMPFQTQYGSPIYRYVFEGVPSYWINPTGIDQSRESWPVYLMHCTVGHHGWLSLTPIFLLVFPGWWQGLRRPGVWRTVCGLSLLLTVWVFAFYLSRTENYNYGGKTSGLRWAFWLIPLWLWTLVPILDQWAGRRWLRALAIVLLFASAISAAMPRANPWQPPWLQTLMEHWGWVDYSGPKQTFPTRKIWLESLPQTAGAGIRLEGMVPEGRVQLDISLVRRQQVEGRTICEVDVKHAVGPSESKLRILLDAGKVERRLTAEECLDHPGWKQAPWEDLAGPTPEMVAFLTGLPERGKATYGVRSTKHLKVPVRTDAFQCRQSVISVDRRENRRSPWRRFRRDAWTADEVPFGLVRVEDTVSDPGDGTILFKQRLELVQIRSGK